MAIQKKSKAKSQVKKSSSSIGKGESKKAPRVGMILKEGGLLLLGAIAFYLFICMISFSPTDPGPFQVSGIGPEAGVPVQNWGGRVGAWIADLMFNVFGKMAYLFIVLIVAAAWHLIDEREVKTESVSVSAIISPVLGFVFAMI